MQETLVQSLGREGPMEKGTGYPLPYSCLENPRGQRSLVGYGPWGPKESDAAEWLSTAWYRVLQLIRWNIFRPRMFLMRNY